MVKIASTAIAAKPRSCGAELEEAPPTQRSSSTSLSGTLRVTAAFAACPRPRWIFRNGCPEASSAFGGDNLITRISTSGRECPWYASLRGAPSSVKGGADSVTIVTIPDTTAMR
jgi:hypothetical protein